MKKLEVSGRRTSVGADLLRQQADKSAVIGINLSEKRREKRKSHGGIVGAGVVWRWVGTLVVARAAWVPRANRHLAPPQRGRPQGSPLHPTPPLRIPPPNVLSLHQWFCFHLLRLMPIQADQSAVGAINRPLQFTYNFFIHPSWLLVIEY
jgi:hypothetical protein